MPSATGPVRVQGARALAGTGRSTLAELRAWLPRSSLSLDVAGTVKFGEHAPELALGWRVERNALAAHGRGRGRERASGRSRFGAGCPMRSRCRRTRGHPRGTTRPGDTSSLRRARSIGNNCCCSGSTAKYCGAGPVGQRSPGVGRRATRGARSSMRRTSTSHGCVRTLPGHVSRRGGDRGVGFSPAAPWSAKLRLDVGQHPRSRPHGTRRGVASRRQLRPARRGASPTARPTST